MTYRQGIITRQEIVCNNRGSVTFIDGNEKCSFYVVKFTIPKNLSFRVIQRILGSYAGNEQEIG